MKKEQKNTLLLLIIYIAILSWIILFKLQFTLSTLVSTRRINLIPFGSSVIINGKMDFDEIINNIIAFIPIGLYLSMLKPNWSFFKKACPILGISLTYEVIQFIFAIGATDITDVITNTTGGVVGILLFFIISKVLKDKANKILHVLAIICTLLLVALLALLIF